MVAYFLILLCRRTMNAQSFETPHSFLLCQSTGDQALELLQHLCANDLDVPVGHIVHTGMLNAKGGYENDCSVVRLSKNRWVTPPPTDTRPNATVENKLKDSSSLRSFFIVSPTDQQVHCWHWIKKHMPSDPQLHLEDVSWKYTGKSGWLSVTNPDVLEKRAEARPRQLISES